MLKRFFILLLAVSPAAFGATAKISWTHPTQYTDGTALPIEQIKETTVQYGTCTTATTPTFGTVIGEVIVAAPANTTTITSIPAASYCWRAKTTDVNSLVSVWSTVIQKAIVEAKPKAPTSVTIS